MHATPIYYFYPEKGVIKLLDSDGLESEIPRFRVLSKKPKSGDFGLRFYEKKLITYFRTTANFYYPHNLGTNIGVFSLYAA